MNEKEAAKAKFGRDPAARKSLFERAILAGWAPFSLGVIFFAALGIWALNLSSDEILELKFWLPFIRGVRIFAPFLDNFANNGASLNVLAFYACAAPFWICFFCRRLLSKLRSRGRWGRKFDRRGREIPRARRILLSRA